MINIRKSNGRSRDCWEVMAMKLAKAVTGRSEDPFVQVGACALRHDHSVAGVGYNGAPPDVDIDWSDRDKRREKVIHAEVNCLNYVKPGEAGLIAVTMLPCCNCLKEIASKRIKYVVYGEEYVDQSSKELAKEFGITMVRLEI